MMQSIEADYPAIKSIVWFNTNKELDWALTETGNTGLTAYNKAVMTDYFGGTLPIKSTASVEEEVIDETPVKPSRGKGKSGKNKTLSTSITRETTLTGLDNAMAAGRMPAVVGERLLSREAEGLRNMSKEDLTAWRISRLAE